MFIGKPVRTGLRTDDPGVKTAGDWARAAEETAMAIEVMSNLTFITFHDGFNSGVV
jgi:hypothetical protein